MAKVIFHDLLVQKITEMLISFNGSMKPASHFFRITERTLALYKLNIMFHMYSLEHHEVITVPEPLILHISYVELHIHCYTLTTINLLLDGISRFGCTLQLIKIS